MSKHFKMYITITDIIGEKRIDLAYPVQGKDVAVISMLSDNVQYWIREPVKVLLITKETKEEKKLLTGTFTGRELNASLGGKVMPPHWLLEVTLSRRTSRQVLKRWLSAWQTHQHWQLGRWKTRQHFTLVRELDPKKNKIAAPPCQSRFVWFF